MFWPRQHVVLEGLLEQVQMEVSYDMGKSFFGLQLIEEISRGFAFNGISSIWVLEHEHMWTRCLCFCLENAECMLQEEEGSSHKYTRLWSQKCFPRSHTFFHSHSSTASYSYSISLPTEQSLLLNFELMSMYALSIIICSITNNAGTAA